MLTYFRAKTGPSLAGQRRILSAKQTSQGTLLPLIMSDKTKDLRLMSKNIADQFCAGDEGAAIIGVSEPSLRRYAAIGRVPSMKIAGRRVYRLADIRRFAAHYRAVRGASTTNTD